MLSNFNRSQEGMFRPCSCSGVRSSCTFWRLSAEDDVFHARALGREGFLFHSADGQYIAAQRDFARHGSADVPGGP